MNASVKVMLSYDYNHFEIALSEECADLAAVNELRKAVQRLADEGVRQYKIAKEMVAKRGNSEYEKKRFEEEIARIKAKPEGERTVNEMAMLQQFKDEQWATQFDFLYDYDDDDDICF